jgi:hypothetical protein
MRCLLGEHKLVALLHFSGWVKTSKTVIQGFRSKHLTEPGHNLAHEPFITFYNCTAHTECALLAFFAGGTASQALHLAATPSNAVRHPSALHKYGQ